MSLNQSGLDNTEEVQSGASVEQPSELNNEEVTTPVEEIAVPAASEETVSEIDAPAASDEAVSASDVPAADDPGISSCTPAVGSSQLKRGDLVEGVIKSTSPTEILVDVGTPNDRVILADELERLNKRTLELLIVGEKLNVYVVNPQGRDGHVILSLNRAAEEMDWQRAEEFRQN